MVLNWETLSVTLKETNLVKYWAAAREHLTEQVTRLVAHLGPLLAIYSVELLVFSMGHLLVGNLAALKEILLDSHLALC